MSDRQVAWIRAQLDATEQAARDAAYSSGGPEWRYIDLETTEKGSRYGGLKLGDEDVLTDVPLDGHQMQHIALHDPAAALADVASKREMLDDLLAEPHYAWDGRSEYGCPKFISADEWADLYDSPQRCDCGRDERVARRIRLLAEGFRGRPGYEEAVGGE